MDPLETFSVTQAGKIIGKAPNTLRTWSRSDYFGPYLSEYANPGPGAERRYTEDDLRILRTAVILQRRGLQISDIIPRIASGEILEELPGEDTIGLQEGRGEPSGRELAPLSLTAQLELFLRPYESQITRLTTDLEKGRGELEQERAARIEAEKELSRLSAKLEGVDPEKSREELERERAARIEAEKELSRLSAKFEERGKPWYKRLFGD